jgi:hypothetical protein
MSIPPLHVLLHKIREALSTIFKLNATLDEIKMNQGILFAALQEGKTSRRLRDYEFKVFSQWGEDGIIQHLTRVVEIRNRTFIEFGVENFFESNCRFLMMKDDWSGFIIDGSASHLNRLRKSNFFWKHELTARNAFITRENINALLAESGFDEDLGILSVDIDGNDYHVLEAITGFRPRILICEFNTVFGASRKISVPYAADFYRTTQHYSNLYFGASLAAMTHLATQRGYSLVGINVANAFYVRNDLLNDRLEVVTPEQAYFPSKERQSRDPKGNPTFLAGDDRLKILRGMPVVNVETGQRETL